MNDNTNPFYVKTCTLAAIATGERANSLAKLRNKLAKTHLGCIYYHFWGGRLHYRFTDTEYHNDFAIWAYHSLHDVSLAEILSIIDPQDFPDLAKLRDYLVQIIDQRIKETESTLWTNKQQQFNFIRSTTMVFETPIVIPTPDILPQCVSKLPPSSIFYHFIDARRRTPDGKDDFSSWLKFYGDGYKSLIEKIEAIDPYFCSLVDLRQALSQVICQHFGVKEEDCHE